MKTSNHATVSTDFESLIKEIKASPTAKSDKRVQTLVKDLEGQVLEAFGRDDWYQKWGKHYLPSLVNAHLFQICNNFKDPGVQVYGGSLFQTLRDKADAVFIKLPPPKPKVSAKSSSSSSISNKSSSAPKAAPVSMKTYHSSSNPCFHGQCTVSMADGSSALVQNLKRGDLVSTPSGKAAEVLCVFKTICAGNVADLVELENNLLVTPYHPVRIQDQWTFPCNLSQPKKMTCDAVYSFILKDEHVMIINGTQCVSLGHNFTQEIVKHPYFGSQNVVEDLKKFKGWSDGLVQLQSGCLVRDPTGLVCGLQQFSS